MKHKLTFTKSDGKADEEAEAQKLHGVSFYPSFFLKIYIGLQMMLFLGLSANVRASEFIPASSVWLDCLKSSSLCLNDLSVLLSIQVSEDTQTII